jgi:hypothetical protein
MQQQPTTELFYKIVGHIEQHGLAAVHAHVCCAKEHACTMYVSVGMLQNASFSVNRMMLARQHL